MSFTGFSEEDLQRMKSTDTGPTFNSNIKRLDKLGQRQKKNPNQYKSKVLQQQNSDDAIDSIDFQKCKLSIRTQTSLISDSENDPPKEEPYEEENVLDVNKNVTNVSTEHIPTDNLNKSAAEPDLDEVRKCSTGSAPDVVRGVTDYSEDELAAHRMKLEELQLKQKIMEEQNKKRKEMLAKALADRTKQTEEEVLRLEKIKKELQVLDGQFSVDVAVLRKKIDQACWSYAEAEKHYLKVEKEFLQAKISLQKEKEKKELLTEHLCALITHNETRKAQKLETLMLELATDRKNEISNMTNSTEDEEPVVIDGVDEKTGKIVELAANS